MATDENLLAERLKKAKQELTALKTAHRRGLGLINCFTYRIDLGIRSVDDDRFLTLNLSFDKNFAKYPMVEIVPENLFEIRKTNIMKGDPWRWAIYSVAYENEGFSIKYKINSYPQPANSPDDTPKSDNMVILIKSSSPVINTSYAWSQNEQ